MKGRIQIILLILASVAATALLVAWATGFLDLDGEGEVDILLEHAWRADGTGGEAEFNNVTLPFGIPSGTGQIQVSYRVDLPSDIVVGLPGSMEDPSPEVRLELRDGGGDVVWSDVFYDSAHSTEAVNVTAAGGWTLHVWARGYGFEGQTGLGTPVEFHDSIKVTVSTS